MLWHISKMDKAGKRKHGPPTGNTPGKPDKKYVHYERSKLNSRKSLLTDDRDGTMVSACTFLGIVLPVIR